MIMDPVEIAKRVMNSIGCNCTDDLRFMEICGTHTQAVSQTGIRSMLPSNITLTSGPGCPVCVTDESHIDAAVEILNKYNVILATFGDMIRVKGTVESLLDQSGKGKNIVVVYSPLEVIALAQKHTDRQVVFFAAGFETTIPLIALAVKTACELRLDNLSFLTSLKLMPQILHRILENGRRKMNGIVCPGHVAAVKGADYFRFITRDYGIPAVICGFEVLDIAAGLFYLVQQQKQGSTGGFKNLYKSCVAEKENPVARQLVQEIFEVGNARWRGIGEVRGSAMSLISKYECYDALSKFKITPASPSVKQQCNCSDVLLGNILPDQCNYFGSPCNPQNPKGPCMVSVEGACSIYYRYRECVC